MKKLTLLFSLILLLTSAMNAQLSISNGIVYTEDDMVIGGTTQDEDPAALTIYSEYSSYNGGGYGILSRHSSNNSSLTFTSKSRTGYSSIWGTQSQGAAYAGTLYLMTDNASSYSSASAGGLFVLEFDDYYPYDNSDNTHFLGGTYSAIRGSISEYPSVPAIAAVIGNDQINSENTYGGYFLGKGYFSDNLGIGTETPSAKVEVADGDIYISDIEKGIIMKSPNEQCWRGTLDNSGNLTFTQITCPDEDGVSTASTLESNSQDISVFPNPAEDQVTVSLDNSIQGKVNYSIYSTGGAFVDAGKMDTDNPTIDVASLSKGLYILELTDKKNNKLYTQKLVKE